MPWRMYMTASPTAIADAAQAVHDATSGPRVPSSIETNAAPMFGIRAGTQKGEKRSSCAS